jgi:alkylation response protein AidB-like acyl-CoA dehydrogenase
MRFQPSDAAVALRDATHDLLTAEVPPAVVRAGWPDGDIEVVRTAWRKLAESGAVGALVPDSEGGLGLDEEALVPTLECLGYAGLPMPVVETIAVAAPLLAGRAWLPDVLAGRATVAIPSPGSALVGYGQDCELVAVVSDQAVRLYELAEARLEPVASIDGGRRLARLLETRDGTVLTDDPDDVSRAHLRGVVGTAAVLVGLSRRMLDLTVGHVTHREQFGVPIGSFQAVKHALASALLSVRFARPAVLAAGWALAADAADAGLHASAAKALASEAAVLVARTALQCHGAMGYTTEYDLHLFAKRAWATAPTWGDAAAHRDRVAARLGL